MREKITFGAKISSKIFIGAKISQIIRRSAQFYVYLQNFSFKYARTTELQMTLKSKQRENKRERKDFSMLEMSMKTCSHPGTCDTNPVGNH